jgi:flagellin
MPLTINTNSAAAKANMHLARNNDMLRKSLNRLSSGSRIVQPVDDAGGLAVSMKLESAITRLSGAQINVQNAISFLEVQDGVMDAAGKIVNRMIELKGLSEDVMKNDSDKDNYNREFQDLQMQIYDMAQVQFNGVSLFAVRDSDSAVGDTVIIGDLGSDNTVSVFVSAEGTSGPTVSVNKAALLSALTIDAGDLATGQAYQTKGTGDVRSFAAADNSEAIDLSAISVGVFTQALENIATLRADNGGTMSRLRFASDNIATTKTNMEAANGRIIDVDVAAESTRLAKYNVLIQASASMLAQANTNNDIALMLLR